MADRGRERALAAAGRSLAISAEGRVTVVIDARAVEAVSGWRVLAHDTVGSTNDEAQRARAAGAGERTAVVADAQTAGRGRGGNRFASPPGGLYVSLLLRVRATDMPAPLVAAVAVALAEAVEAVGVPRALVKWPNDVWVGDAKVAGILAEADAIPRGAHEPRVPVIVGIGVNVERVPEGLPSGVVSTVTALHLHTPTPVRREALLGTLLAGVDRRLLALDRPAGRIELEAAYRDRMALRGDRVRFLVGDAPKAGVLEDVGLERGLLVRLPDGVSAWFAAAHVRELRKALS